MESQQEFKTPVLTAAKRSSDWYEVEWTDGYTGRYPYVWLRDNCRCSSCFYPSALQRIAPVCSIDVDIEPESDEIIDHGQELKISWPDGHTSEFPSKWLYLNRFDKMDFDPVKKLVPKGWGSEMVDQLPKFDFKAVMEDSRILRDWLRSLVVSGLTLITGAPKEEGVVEEIGKRVGYLRTTMYGRTFKVIAVPSSNNVAYTSKDLFLHSDLASCDHPPDVQMLHCIKQCQTIGGESHFSDGLQVVNQLKQSYPEFYDVLTTIKVDSRSRGEDFMPFHYQSARPIITLDEDGSFQSLMTNHALRAPYTNIPVDSVKLFYKSLACLEGLFTSKEHLIEFKLKEGEIVVFNNNRVLHGRAGYQQILQAKRDEDIIRHLEGAYIDWDVIKSRVRLLEEELDDMPIL